jgi:hypothetical protein
MRSGILGTGSVGRALASRLAELVRSSVWRDVRLSGALQTPQFNFKVARQRGRNPWP